MNNTINAEAPQGAPSTPRPDATVMSAGTSSPPSSVKRVVKQYSLRPAATTPLPARAVKRVVEYLKKKSAANAAYAELREIEAKLMPSRGRKLIKPGVVYELPEAVTFGDGLIRAFGFVDQFTGKGSASKTVTINQYEFKKWAHGPKDKVES